MSHFKLLLLLAVALTLTACGGEKTSQPVQMPPARIETTGVVNDGVNTGVQSIVAKGVVGPTRTTQTAADGKYTVSMTDLTGPYFFSNNLSPTANPQFPFMTAPATRIGKVNVTPLTTLLTAQLFGAEPANVFSSYGSNTPLAAQISDSTIQAAQAEVVQYLQDVLGVQVKSGTASFVTGEFNPTAGDAMFDTIQALGARLAATSTTLKDLSARIALGARACQTESIQITIDGVKKPFCPVVKGGVPLETDITVIDYQFKNISDDTLAVRIQGNVLLSASFTTVGGRVFQCADAACGLIVLGTPAADLSRDIDFASATLSGAAGSSALIDGKLVAPEPSITLPLLPCSDNRFFVIFEDHDVIGTCVDATNPTPIPGTFGGPAGPGRESYSFSNSLSPLPSSPRISVVLDTSTPEPSIVSVYYQDSDPDVGGPRNRFLCRFAACNGVIIGPRTIDNSAGQAAETFTITLNDTVLSGLNEDGTPTQTTVSVRGSFSAVIFVGTPGAYPALVACDPASDAINVKVKDGEFNVCIAIGMDAAFSFDLGDGRTQFFITDVTGMNSITLFVDNATQTLLNANVSFGDPIGEAYDCTTDCSGISISADDGTGHRAITFSNAILHKPEEYPLPGDRTITLDSPPITSTSF